MNTLSTVKARKQFSDLINRTAYGKERIVISRRGKGLMVLIPIEDLRLIEMAEDLIDIKEAEIALKDYENGNVVSLEDVEQRLNA